MVATVEENLDRISYEELKAACVFQADQTTTNNYSLHARWITL